ncbi:prolyl aminopeptidase [Actinopolyspora mortivallis]|uniref:Proline iminopeptidase n=1 Tax=Actinopolyspora mortivallis TaxID=33906 RepID=A0A2T0GSM7_ACTMO|nr:prolyl aminopeptidase [Actinopolyspora mortivallis]PRW62097.1 prolyl aminopeptidase [Actinopolyspora mortivallis]
MPYPIPDPHRTGTLDVGEGHRIHWEVRGAPDSEPAVVLHGGPGSGALPGWQRFFDPDRYRVVLFDQRGCGRSTPHAGDTVAALNHNTTAHLISDLERLREHLGIERWLLFGASWGSTLGLAYAVEHPQRVSELVLWSVVTTRAHEVAWMTHTMGHVHPHEFAELLHHLPAERRDGNIPAAFHDLLVHPDPEIHHAAARAWCAWEDRVATLSGPVEPSPRYEDPRFRLGFARLVTHYFGNHAFLPDDGITGRLHRIAHLPALLVRGRVDIASPLSAAVEVAERLPRSRLHVVEDEAHSAGPETERLLTAALDEAASRRD